MRVYVVKFYVDNEEKAIIDKTVSFLGAMNIVKAFSKQLKTVSVNNLKRCKVKLEVEK